MPFRLRLPTTTKRRVTMLAFGGVVMAIGASVAWRWYDGRLAGEARRLAADGSSAAVVTLRDDWAAAVVPVALTDRGQPGVGARRAAMAKLDLAIRAAERGDGRPLIADATQVLAAIRSTSGPFTDQGKRWIRWVAERLATAAEQVGPAPSLLLVQGADELLARVGPKTRLPAKPPAAVAPRIARAVPEQPVMTDQPVAPAAPRVVEQRPAPAPEPEPLPMTAETKPLPAAKPSAPLAWGAPPRTAPPVVEKETGGVPVTLATASDRELLRQLLGLYELLPTATVTAYGPTSAPTEVEGAEAETRRRLDALRGELTSRGFRAVTTDQIEALLSNNVATRQRLAEDLLTARTGDGARLLLVLASDDAAAVRAAAISALGSSNNRSLVQAAWDLAQRDPDARVGRLAEPLRQRLR